MSNSRTRKFISEIHGDPRELGMAALKVLSKRATHDLIASTTLCQSNPVPDVITDSVNAMWQVHEDFKTFLVRTGGSLDRKRRSKISMDMLELLDTVVETPRLSHTSGINYIITPRSKDIVLALTTDTPGNERFVLGVLALLRTLENQLDSDDQRMERARREIDLVQNIYKQLQGCGTAVAEYLEDFCRVTGYRTQG